ncbi:trehalase-like domain-containing protein [Streptomyces sp. NPDC004647]|uniref:trehalase-like domain-containing protein n=1 Tax=Streptomyces sp. NPDC004647 TaxID=3154671 RepID=UPI0033AA672E
MSGWSPASRERYLPIEDHGLIGDGRGCALVGRDGAVRFMCVPRFDAPPLFCSLLDRQRGGSFLLAPEMLRQSRQHYVEDTGVLVTELHADTGVVEITDLPPPTGRAPGGRRPSRQGATGPTCKSHTRQRRPDSGGATAWRSAIRASARWMAADLPPPVPEAVPERLAAAARPPVHRDPERRGGPLGGPALERTSRSLPEPTDRSVDQRHRKSVAALVGTSGRRLASSISGNSVCRRVPESVGDHSARDCRAEVTALRVGTATKREGGNQRALAGCPSSAPDGKGPADYGSCHHVDPLCLPVRRRRVCLRGYGARRVTPDLPRRGVSAERGRLHGSDR